MDKQKSDGLIQSNLDICYGKSISAYRLSVKIHRYANPVPDKGLVFSIQAPRQWIKLFHGWLVAKIKFLRLATLQQ